jgi:acyl-coenzyme A synthetase/AMP-(fatty) acid ligase
MTGKHLNLWRQALPEARFTNVYGPSETTVDCAFYQVNREFADDESIPIGNACHNSKLFLLDSQLVVGGTCVGLGYYGDTKRTEAVFVQNPLQNDYREIVYLTGDLAKINVYGEFVYLGRADSQVKHMGTRVELGEIETIANALEQVELACCAYDKGRGKIVLFYQGQLKETEVGTKLSALLPRYMLPGDIRHFEQLPTLPNGKLDRQRLLQEI